MSTVETLRVGDRIADKYIIERVLGKGGMGMVVAARHVDLDQVVAIKFILPDALRQHGIVERLLREARASAKLRGEHVARVTDVGRTPDGAPYLVMELLEGKDLADMIDTRGTIPEGEAALYVGQACEAIAEAHAAGIIHRDIKPANLFVTTRRDGSPCVKVLDFGIAKEDSLANAAMTSTGSVLGTPMYMSPEQVRSAKTATPATDIWALGISLYELTTGSIPYDVTTVTELIAKILTEAPIPPRARNPSVSPEMEAVIMRCLQVDPANRYRSAAELQAALAPLAPHRGSAASIPESLALAGSGRHPAHPVSAMTPTAVHTSGVAPAPGGAVQGASVVAASRLLAQGTESGTSVAIAPPKRGSRTAILAVAIVGALGVLGGGAAFFLTRTPPPPSPAVSARPDAEPARPAETPTPSAPTAAPELVPAPSADSAPSAVVAPSAEAPSAAAPPPSAKAEAPQPTAKKPPPSPPKPPPATPPPPSAKPGWGGLL